MRSLLTIVIVSSLISYQAYPQDYNSNEITAGEIQEHINYLASDELKGRGTGTEECHMAAKYIENEFIQYGLKPLFGNSYYQEFPFISSIELTKNNRFTITLNEKELSPVLKKDYITVPFSGNSNITGELVFAGFGIAAPDLEYDDYEGFNVKDKIVVVMRNHPEPDVPHSEFEPHSSLRKKSAVARDKGALGIIFVNGYEEYLKEDKLIEFKYDRGGEVTGMAIVSAMKNVIEELFASQNLSFEEHYQKIIETKKPASFKLENTYASISTEVIGIEDISWNVAGYLEGNDPSYKEEYIIIGGHYDHLGMGGEGSLYRGDDPQIHNGADDNASGTTGVLELAEKFSSEKGKLSRSIIFITFSGEEMGLLGSNYFVNNMPYPSEDMICMVNMDMIGRLNDENSLIVYGTGTSSNWEDILNENNTYSLNLTFNEEGYGPSDHSSFYGKKIPVLFFFTGTHEDYHRPSDDADKINSSGEETVLKYIYDVTSDIERAEERPDYLRVERKDKGPVRMGKVWVGTIPDFASNVDGYKISGVSEGSPAENAGLEGGDIIIKFGEKKISNIYDFTYAIGDYVPGDVVDIVVIRGEEEITFTVELGSR